MSYRFLEAEALADVAFEATAISVEQVFLAAAEALLNTMVESVESIRPRQSRTICTAADSLELLLYEFLEELVYSKDAEGLLLRVSRVEIEQKGSSWHVSALARGEEIDPIRHEQRADVKAITWHRFKLESAGGTWRCFVILDV
jgi:SHS2 domain-containing protein